jgi:hypothetical protein
MNNSFVTIAVVALSVVLNLMLLGPFTAGNANVAYILGRLFGTTAMAFAIGAAGAWLFGKLRGTGAGALHRRTNWIALITILLSAAGRLASGQ